MFEALPMFHRVGAAAYRADLSNTIRLMDTLGQPQNGFKSIHIAGTNGKGSTSHALAAVLQAAGYKTGLYTSPHLKDFRERIRINGAMIPQEEVVRFYENIMRGKCPPEKKPATRSFSTPSTGAAAPVTPPLQPSFFEMTTALAFHYFAQQKIDIAVIETGMGGRLDSTNVITPELSIITNISLDHTQFLGTTLETIAAEKAGIIKHNIPVIIGETQQQTKQIFIQKAKENNAEIIFADEEFTIKPLNIATFELQLHHHGLDKNISGNHNKQSPAAQTITTDLAVTSYQQKNFATVFCALDLLKKKFPNINEEAIHNGFANIIKNTGLQGRWQKIAEKPLIIADTGHNEGGIKLTLEQIQATPHKNLHIVWGMVSDKDITHILGLLPKTAKYYFCCPPLPRGLNENELQKKAAEHKLAGQAYKTVQQALQVAKQAASQDDLIYIGGSNFIVAEVI
ncbi:MAG: bifunctional folylpolyglutamate synthase/dihydrofolate synthase [Bacteroidales bacterium]|jgi:dihydrofolate synthase/folylpolyglutamate synthase|nr:bifunctional folylpolyglutamate synthase/dihydrofolate synthase [Bacteroidales bacterium]